MCIAIIFSPKLLIHFSFDSFILVNEGDFSRPEKKNKNTNEVNTYENIAKKVIFVPISCWNTFNMVASTCLWEALWRLDQYDRRNME